MQYALQAYTTAQSTKDSDREEKTYLLSPGRTFITNVYKRFIIFLCKNAFINVLFIYFHRLLHLRLPE